MRTFALLLGLSLAAPSPCALLTCLAAQQPSTDQTPSNGQAADQAFDASTQIHVSTTGDDSFDGSDSAPVRTLHRAAELVRKLREPAAAGTSPKAIEVILQGGEYSLERTLALTAEDSGSEEFPVVYRSASGESVTISGAIGIQRLGLARESGSYPQLQPEAAQRVIAYSVPAAHQEAWSIHERGESQQIRPCSVELFSSGKLFQRASSPRKDWGLFNRDTAGSFDQGVLGEHTWIHGFPSNDYQDEFMSLATAKESNWRSGARYRLENVLSELDEPGEWYLDCENRRFLWWPDDSAESDLRVSNLETLISLYDVQNVRVEGLTLEGARVQAIEIAGGFGVGVNHNTIRCIGNVGINVFHGEAHTVAYNTIHSVGSSGIRIEGGHRDGGIPADHVCLGNTVFNCSAHNLARHAAIAVHGVGITVTENEIHTLPDWAISIHGDGHTIQKNDIHHVCTQTSDSGAIYLSHDSSFHDNLISHNHIHHVGGFDQKSVFGIYLDRDISNTQVIANWIHDTPRAIVVRGGSGNQLEANVIHDCWVGVQFEWSRESAENQLRSNVIESPNALVVSSSISTALIAKDNSASLNDVFVNARTGDFRFTSADSAHQLGLDQWDWSLLSNSKSKLVNTEVGEAAAK